MTGAEQITEREDPSLETLLKALADISSATSAAYFQNELGRPRQTQSQLQQGFGPVANQSQGQSQRQSGGGSQSQGQGQSQSQGQRQSQK